jgi:hypothetical protein
LPTGTYVPVIKNNPHPRVELMALDDKKKKPEGYVLYSPGEKE